MQKLEELIQKLCPNGVEYKNLEDCCTVLDNRRKPVKKGVRTSGNYPYYGANGIQDYVSSYIFDGKFVLVGEDGSVLTQDGKPVVTWAEGKIWVNNHAHIIESNGVIALRFLYHFIQTIDIVALVHGNIPKLTGKDFRALKIPVPPIEVQEEIVRILDKFTELSAELTAELSARQKQYEYYRNELLNVESRIKNVELKRLGDVCNIGDGLHGTPEYDENGEVYFINGNNVKGGKIQFDNNTKKINNMEYQKLRLPFDNNTLFLSINGTIGNVAIYRNERIALGKSVAYFNIITDKLNRKYLFYILQSAKAQIYFKNSVTGGTIKNLGLKALREFQIQIPPLEEQKRIVAILDHFDKLCNDISEGLPAEIKARQKQYEYYREKLLQFRIKN